jgi:hypothetical protein
MFTVIANKIKKTVLEVSGLDFDIDNVEFVEKFKKDSLAIVYKVTPFDLCMYRLTNEEEQRFIEGDAYTIVWEGDKVTGFDFGPEDAKRKYTITVDKNDLEIGNSVTITARLFQADGITPYTVINAKTRLPIITPWGQASVVMQFVNGVATKTVTPATAGIYRVGAKRYSNFVLKGELPVVEVDM